MTAFLRFFAFAILASCNSVATATDPPPAARRVLFVGNSLTYFNDLPATVGAIAASASDPMAIATAAGADLALIDHLNGATNAVRLMRDSSWDYVVLQQGPTTSAPCRDSLVLWTRMFDEKVRAAHGRTALFMTWPTSADANRWGDVRASFQLAAQSVTGVFLPAGEAWRIALAERPELQLYGKDGFHPTPMGSFLAALEIYARLSGRDPRALVPQAFAYGLPITMSADTVRWLQQAAYTANRNYPAYDPAPIPVPSTDYRPPGSTTC